MASRWQRVDHQAQRARWQELLVYRLADGRTDKLFTVDGSAYACPSPDGNWIAYALSKDGKSTVWLWDRAKQAHRQLTTEGFENLAYGCFSPDSRSILYRSTRTGTGDLWRLDVATGERRQLTQDIAEDQNGTWSPDGSHVVFVSNRGGQWDLWILGAGEQDVQRVTDDAVPENNTGVDTRRPRTGLERGRRPRAPVPGATIRGSACAMTSGAWYVNDAQVSPDGSRIAYSGTKNGDEDISVVPSTGGESHLVSGAPGFDGAVAWSPDGKQVSFTSRRSGNNDIWIAPADSGAARRLTNWPSAEPVRAGPRRQDDRVPLLSRIARRRIWTMPVSGGAPTASPGSATSTRIAGARTESRSLSRRRSTRLARCSSCRQRAERRGGSHRLPVSLPSGHRTAEIKVMQCDKGYCTIEIHAVDGKHLRTLTTTRVNPYEFDASWSHSGSQMLINWQDIPGDGGLRVDVRPSAGGAGRTLKGPPGFTMHEVGFTAGDSAAIMIGSPLGNASQRIDVSSAVKASRR